jgi:hypothetical protein
MTSKATTLSQGPPVVAGTSGQRYSGFHKNGD